MALQGRDLGRHSFRAVGFNVKTIPCPFVYVDGRECSGHIVRVEALKADLEWLYRNELWTFSFSAPRSRYHLFCSENGDHAEVRGEREISLKFYFQELPTDIQDAILASLSRLGGT